MYLLFSFYRNVVSFVEIYDKIVLLKWKRGDVKLDVIVTRTNREEKKSMYEFLEETLQIDLSSVYGGVFGHQVTVDRKDKKNWKWYLYIYATWIKSFTEYRKYC